MRPKQLISQPQYSLPLVAELDGLRPIVGGVPGLFASKIATSFGSLSASVSKQGRGLSFSSANTDTPVRRLEWADEAWNDPTGAITIVSVFDLSTPPTRSNRAMMAKYRGVHPTSGTAVNDRAFQFYIDHQTHASNNYIRLAVSSAGTGASTVASATGSHVPNGLHVGVAVYVPNVRMTVHLDGTQYAETTAGVPASIFNSPAPLWVGVTFSIVDTGLESQYTFPGSIFCYALFSGAASQALARNLSLNPWQIFASRPARIYSFPSAGGASEGVGTSAGDATVSGVGNSTVQSVGASTGVATANGVGSAIIQAVGSAAGVATVAGVGSTLGSDPVGSSSGVAGVSGVGGSIVQALGAATGVATVDGVGSSLVAAVGVSNGTSNAVGIYDDGEEDEIYSALEATVVSISKFSADIVSLPRFSGTSTSLARFTVDRIYSEAA